MEEGDGYLCSIFIQGGRLNGRDCVGKKKLHFDRLILVINYFLKTFLLLEFVTSLLTLKGNCIALETNPTWIIQAKDR